jgi:mono/diheme cytochrome c family protein
MTRKFMMVLLLSGVLVFGAACGSIATPVPVAVADAEVDGEEDATEEAHSEEAEVTVEVVEATEEVVPTAIPPTATTVPTAIPPTATTEVVTEEVEEEAEVDLVAAAIAAGDVANGQTVFGAMYQTSGGGWMCSSCHSVDESEARLVGPGLYNIYTRAEERIAESGDPDVVTYVVNSIIYPADYHVSADPAYPENLMPQNYEEVLTEQELADVVGYVLSLGYPGS